MLGEELVTLMMSEVAALRIHWLEGRVLPDKKLQQIAEQAKQHKPQPELQQPKEAYDPPNKLG